MTRHQRPMRLSVLVLLAVTATALAAAKTHTVASKGTAANNHVSTSTLTVSADTSPTVGQTPTATGTSSPLYKLDWYSINGGGAIDASSSSYKMGLSVGQSVAGEANSASYKMGIGFWHGAGACSCPHQGDLIQNDFIDVADVLAAIKVAFVNGTDTQDPECPTTRADVNANGVVDVADVLYIIKTAFVNGPVPVDPCTP